MNHTARDDEDERRAGKQNESGAGDGEDVDGLGLRHDLTLLSEVQVLGQQLDALNKQDNTISSSIGLTECAKDVSPQG
jgi:hypothetical protein